MCYFGFTEIGRLSETMGSRTIVLLSVQIDDGCVSREILCFYSIVVSSSDASHWWYNHRYLPFTSFLNDFFISFTSFILRPEAPVQPDKSSEKVLEPWRLSMSTGIEPTVIAVVAEIQNLRVVDTWAILVSRKSDAPISCLKLW
ncbi:hypothetical protein FQR65_LT11491 [Abscondita terminalis]|nr:hypothetical protein FQR65_LT11491 [Abscondita terminalis]